MSIGKFPCKHCGPAVVGHRKGCPERGDAAPLPPKVGTTLKTRPTVQLTNGSLDITYKARAGCDAKKYIEGVIVTGIAAAEGDYPTAVWLRGIANELDPNHDGVL